MIWSIYAPYKRIINAYFKEISAIILKGMQSYKKGRLHLETRIF